MKLNYTATILAISILALVGVESCKNDIDIFAPEKDVTLIYGLLSVDDAVHQIKINRVFQGQDAIDKLAKDPKLSEYENLSARLIELKDNGVGGFDTLQDWPLVERTISNKDSGYFYYPNQKIYEATATLNNKYNYAVWVDKLDGSKIVESTTELIRMRGEILKKPKPQSLNRIGLSLALNGKPLESIEIEMNLPFNAKVVDVYLDFTWHDEFYSGAADEYHTISYKVGTDVVANIPTQDSDQGIVKIDLIPSAFYQFIAANAPVVPNGSDLKQRVAHDIPLKFRFIVGGNELNTYVEVASPSTSLLETKPEYTNVINGVGIFSCRSFSYKTSLMSKSSIEYLVNGEIMAGSKFCNYSNSTSTDYCF